MRIASIVSMIALASLICGCAKSAASASRPPAVSHPEMSALKNASDVTVRIRKLAGADKKQVVNQIKVATPINDEFAVTDQVGGTQLELRGKVLDLQNGMYRVSYQYVETSANGRQQLKSLIEMPLNSEKEIGGLVGRGDDAAGMETLVLSLSRP